MSNGEGSIIYKKKVPEEIAKEKTLPDTLPSSKQEKTPSLVEKEAPPSGVQPRFKQKETEAPKTKVTLNEMTLEGCHDSYDYAKEIGIPSDKCEKFKENTEKLLSNKTDITSEGRGMIHQELGDLLDVPKVSNNVSNEQAETTFKMLRVDKTRFENGEITREEALSNAQKMVSATSMEDLHKVALGIGYTESTWNSLVSSVDKAIADTALQDAVQNAIQAFTDDMQQRVIDAFKDIDEKKLEEYIENADAEVGKNATPEEKAKAIVDDVEEDKKTKLTE